MLPKTIISIRGNGRCGRSHPDRRSVGKPEASIYLVGKDWRTSGRARIHRRRGDKDINLFEEPGGVFASPHMSGL
jgi:hypothetical protein